MILGNGNTMLNINTNSGYDFQNIGGLGTQEQLQFFTMQPQISHACNNNQPLLNQSEPSTHRILRGHQQSLSPRGAAKLNSNFNNYYQHENRQMFVNKHLNHTTSLTQNSGAAMPRSLKSGLKAPQIRSKQVSRNAYNNGFNSHQIMGTTVMSSSQNLNHSNGANFNQTKSSAKIKKNSNIKVIKVEIKQSDEKDNSQTQKYKQAAVNQSYYSNTSKPMNFPIKVRKLREKSIDQINDSSQKQNPHNNSSGSAQLIHVNYGMHQTNNGNYTRMKHYNLNNSQSKNEFITPQRPNMHHFHKRSLDDRTNPILLNGDSQIQLGPITQNLVECLNRLSGRNRSLSTAFIIQHVNVSSFKISKA
eukprot:403376272